MVSFDDTIVGQDNTVTFLTNVCCVIDLISGGQKENLATWKKKYWEENEESIKKICNEKNYFPSSPFIFCLQEFHVGENF